MFLSRSHSHRVISSARASASFLRSTSAQAHVPALTRVPVRSIFGMPSLSSHNDSTSYSTRGKPNFGVVIVPQQSAYLVEWFGKFDKILSPGLHFLVPFIHRIAYIHNLKEQAIPVMAQQAITADNVTIRIDGVLYIKIVDPEKASYGVADIYFAMTQLAQTAMRSELGKITLDKIFGERESLNLNIVKGLSAAAEPWGIQCLRYEIRDIEPPPSVKQAMDMQAEAERQKRASILNSEGQQQSAINVADGQRQATVLAAQGEAAAILAKASATAEGISILAGSIGKNRGKEAVSMLVAEQYIGAFSQLAKSSNTMLLPTNASDPSSMIAQAMAIFSNVNKQSAASNQAEMKSIMEQNRNDNESHQNQNNNNNNNNNQGESHEENSNNNSNRGGTFNPQTGRVE